MSNSMSGVMATVCLEPALQGVEIFKNKQRNFESIDNCSEIFV